MVLDQGMVLEIGTFEELKKKNNAVFREMYHASLLNDSYYDVD